MINIDGKLIVANAEGDSLSIIDLKDGFKIENIYLSELLREFMNSSENANIPCMGPHEIVYNKNKGKIYSINSYNNSIFKIDLKSKILENMVLVGCFPSHLKICNGNMYITNSDSNSISVVDEDKFDLIENIPVDEKPHGIEVDTSNAKVYVANNNGHSINIIDLKSTKIDRIKLNCNPLHLYYQNGNIYILSSANGTNSKIALLNLDTTTIQKIVEIEGVIIDLVIIEKKDILFVTNAENGYLYKIDLNESKVVDKYYLGGMPNNIIKDDFGYLYITNGLNDTVSIFDSNQGKIIKILKVGKDPNGLIIV